MNGKKKKNEQISPSTHWRWVRKPPNYAIVFCQRAFLLCQDTLTSSCSPLINESFPIVQQSTFVKQGRPQTDQNSASLSWTSRISAGSTLVKAQHRKELSDGYMTLKGNCSLAFGCAGRKTFPQDNGMELFGFPTNDMQWHFRPWRWRFWNSFIWRLSLCDWWGFLGTHLHSNFLPSVLWIIIFSAWWPLEWFFFCSCLLSSFFPALLWPSAVQQ